MKLSKLAIIAAIISTSLFSACTPNSLDEDEELSSIKKGQIPRPTKNLR